MKTTKPLFASIESCAIDSPIMAGSQRSRSSVDEKRDDLPHAAIEDGKASENVETALYIDPAEEKKLLFKLDLFLTPVIMLVYLCCFLDRSNIGK